MVEFTNWYVLDGGPSVGKTRLVKSLKELRPGVHFVDEVATRLINDFKAQRGRSPTKAEVYAAPFQAEIHLEKMGVEDSLDPKELVVLDRGLPCDIAYEEVNGRDPAEFIEDAKKRRYAGVFLLQRPPGYETNGIRVEDRSEARTMDVLVRHAYRRLGYIPVSVPVFTTVKKRAEFVAARLA